MTKELTKEELQKLTIKQIKLIDISSKEYEKLINEVLDSKVVNAPIEIPVSRHGIPDIKTPEEEATYQKIMDIREAAKRPVVSQETVIEIKGEGTIDESGEVKSEITEVKEIVPTVITIEEEKPRFCDKCDSKGVAHKKNCPNKK